MGRSQDYILGQDCLTTVRRRHGNCHREILVIGLALMETAYIALWKTNCKNAVGAMGLAG